MKNHEIQLTGNMAKSMNHGLAICDKNGWIFIETKKKKEGD